jgi:hypothetical protein
MEIRRDHLAAEFATFERQGNGVVIGAPGVGKTHLLANHFRAAVAANRPAFLLPLDKHSVRNDLELQTELQLDRDLIDTLNAEARATTDEPGFARHRFVRRSPIRGGSEVGQNPHSTRRKRSADALANHRDRADV